MIGPLGFYCDMDKLFEVAVALRYVATLLLRAYGCGIPTKLNSLKIRGAPQIKGKFIMSPIDGDLRIALLS